MRYGLIIVDMQYDFLPGGALGVPDGTLVIDNIIRLGWTVENNGGFVVLTQDWHPKDHCSFSDEPEYKDGSWPVHCVQGTRGAEIHEEVLAAFPDAPIVQKGYEAEFEAYSGFDDGKLQQMLVENEVTRTFIVGLAADYCVYLTVLDSFSLGFETSVILDATLPVAWHTGAEAMFRLGRYSGNGIEAITTDWAIRLVKGP